MLANSDELQGNMLRTSSGQIAKCEIVTMSTASAIFRVQVCGPETGVEKVRRKWLQRTGPQVFAKLGFEVFILCADVRLHP